MFDLNDLYYFVQVVDCQGITPAARKLGIPTSRLSCRVSGLEVEPIDTALRVHFPPLEDDGLLVKVLGRSAQTLVARPQLVGVWHARAQRAAWVDAKAAARKRRVREGSSP